jgi:ribosomal protein S18 acetylase RimI-like enzyme
MEQIVIRNMQYEDVNAVVDVYAEIFDGTYVGFGEISVGMGKAPGVSCEQAPDIFRDELHDLLRNTTSNGLFVASSGSKVIGFAVVVLQPKDIGLECWLNDLGVSLNWQKQGVGQKLMEKVFDWAFQEKGAKYCLLESGVKNKAAHKLFERMGFQPLSTVFWKGSCYSTITEE